MRLDESLTPERAKELLSYNKRTGLLTWKVARRGGAKRGDEAGCTNTRGLVIVTIDNKIYPASRLAWLLAHGQWPKGRIVYKNRKAGDLRLENLQDEAKIPPLTKSAQYQRRYRKEQRAVKRLIMRTPELLEQWTLDPDKVYQHTLARVRAQQRRHDWEFGDLTEKVEKDPTDVNI